MKKTILKVLALALILWGCGTRNQKQIQDNMLYLSKEKLDSIVDQLTVKHGKDIQDLARRGVMQIAALWKESDGTFEEFEKFSIENFIGDAAERHKLFEKLSINYETIWGHLHQINVDFSKGVHLDREPMTPVDLMFASYSPYAHLAEDFFRTKIAFVTVLNFPFFTLDEKNQLGQSWSRKEWAYARMGDIFTSRVPSEINQENASISTKSESYISEYNIIMDNLLDDEGNQIFTGGRKLISHWGLRDELKSHYGNAEGLANQRMIYQVMKRIIAQDIPVQVINNDGYKWNPYTNEVFDLTGSRAQATPEPDTRYQHLLNSFLVGKKADNYSPNYPTAIERAFNQGLEMTLEEVEAIFIELVSSPVVAEVGKLVSSRLGRPLEPFDIWYDGFKPRSLISDELLSKAANKRYPSALALENDLATILKKFGWTGERAQSIASKIIVEGSRGPGHAWGARMRTNQPSYLRTRIGANGMDYKGYNIAMHELGHNVEQTITLHDVDYYMMNGVPNTAFTEALAFIFQVRDLAYLGFTNTDPNQKHLAALDVFWGTYEIMGVSLVDMAVWKWMYQNPNATAAHLKENVIRIATEIWNKYFYPAFGVKDSPILAIYSHMINYPLYLSAYPLGHLIEFQLEAKITGLNIGAEMDRVFGVGKLTPNAWMQNAVGGQVSARPMIQAIEKALVAKFD